MLSRHERYLGMWADDLRCGPGMIVSSTGTYCEATFASGTIAVSACCMVPTYVGPVVLFQVSGLIPWASGLIPYPKSHSM